jgi:putative MATE family efflux protein
VGIANMIIMTVLSMSMGLIIGARAMIARFIGALDIRGANHIAGQAIILSTTWGIIITVIGLTLAEPVLNMFGLEPEVVSEGAAYLRIMFAGWASMEVLVMCLYYIQASGDAITPMKIEFILRVIHVTICPFLVLGLWEFPRMGVSGAALSNVISQCLGVVIILWTLFKGHTRLRPTFKDLRPAPNTIWRMLKISIPALVMNLQRSFGNLILTWFIVPFGTLAVAAHSLASRIEMFIVIPSMAVGTSAGVLVGQNLGSDQPERAEKSTWLAVGLVEAFMVACSIALLLWAEYIMGIFTTEPGLVEIGSVFLRIATGSYLVMAFVTVLQTSIAGAGDTIPTMVVSIAMIWVVQLPLAFFLPQITTLGVYGVRWAIVASTLSATIAYITYFRLGKWKTKKV